MTKVERTWLILQCRVDLGIINVCFAFKTIFYVEKTCECAFKFWKSASGRSCPSSSLHYYPLAEYWWYMWPTLLLPLLRRGQRSHRVTSPYKHLKYHHGTKAAWLSVAETETPPPQHTQTLRGIRHWYAYKWVCVKGKVMPVGWSVVLQMQTWFCSTAWICNFCLSSLNQTNCNPNSRLNFSQLVKTINRKQFELLRRRI